MIGLLIALGLMYVAIDLVTGIYYGECVVPGLKCRQCRSK